MAGGVNRTESLCSIADTKRCTTIWPQDWNDIGGLAELPSPLKQPIIRPGQQSLEAWSLAINTSKAECLDIWWRTLFGDTLSREARIDSSPEDSASVPPRDGEGVEKLCRHLTEYLQIQVHAGRRMFKTRDGKLGLAPPAAQTGDIVCVLSGGDVPYVLREKDIGNWEFVGECSLHGMMDGQGFAGKSTEEFIIHG